MHIRRTVQQLQEAHRKGQVMATLKNFVSHKARCACALRHLAANRVCDVSLHRPDYIPTPTGEQEVAIAGRIFSAFRKMKEDQARQSGIFYRPASLWQEQLDAAYAPLGSGVKSGDLDHFHHFLANFGAWREYTGIETHNLLHNIQGRLQEAMFLHDVFLRSLEEWRWFCGGRRPVSVLSYPQVGNQSGVLLKGQFVGLRSFFNDIYGDILGGILDGRQRPVLADLGAGYGLLDYFTLRRFSDFTYLDFDLPETLCLAAYYLMNVWPEKKALLYGEAEYSTGSHAQYDLVFMPSWEIEKLGEDSVDLFLNTNSLGEMGAEAVGNYLGHICRAARYVFHINHETKINIFAEGEGRSLVAPEFPLPSGQFRRLMRYPDQVQVSFGNKVGWDEDMFFYLYEKIRPAGG